MEKVTGRTLIDWGFKPSRWFPAAIEAGNRVLAGGGDERAVRAAVDALVPFAPPVVPLRPEGELAHTMNLGIRDAAESANWTAVNAHMRELMRVPTVVAGAVMPDACPSDRLPGTIPVGGIVATREAIHPGMHSADICCSVAITVFEDADPQAVLDAGMVLSHFGPGGRPRGQQIRPPTDLMERFERNRFLVDCKAISPAIEHFATQGDGNHFYYVGILNSTGQVALVTHHGSRKPGALLYKWGIAAAQFYREMLSPETARHNAWIPSETPDGDTYWDALQIIRDWTKASHFQIHDIVAGHLGLKRIDRFWNEHNFVFRKSDGAFYHAKGATPAFAGYAADASGHTLIPLNMAQPILITRGLDAPHGLGFAPHGAGRNLSRTAYMKLQEGKTAAEMIAEQAPGIDVRFFSGNPDPSELPLAYKDAATVRSEIARYGLAEVVDEVHPYGSIMAGDWEKDAPWRKKRDAKRAKAAAAAEVA